MNRNVKIIFFGATNFSREILLDLLSQNFCISSIFSIPSEFNISYSKKKVKNYNFSSLREIAENADIPYYEVDSVEGKRIEDYQYVFQKEKPDVILVMGWYYMVPRVIRDSAKYGAWGIHASLLPKYAGGAPLVWAMINGEKQTGVTLFKLDSGVDDGDIISQASIDIKFDDTVKEVYENATKESKQILADALANIQSIEFRPQNKLEIEVYPQRNPDDGEIDLTMPALSIYNFVRAQSSPYPGAFIRSADGKKIIIEKVRIEADLNEKT